MYSEFNLNKINNILSSYNERIGSLLNIPLSISSYDDFITKIPIMHNEDLSRLSLCLQDKNILKNCSFTISSGTTGNYKLLAHSMWRDITKDSYPKQLVETLIKNKIFEPDDVVSNLFTAGGMSTLYDGVNRILEGCRVSLIPIGRLDAIPSIITPYFSLLEKTKSNVLFGTPASIIQCLDMINTSQRQVNISKVVFTGESLSIKKREYIKSFYPDIKIYGLYGHSETGFVGINSLDCNYNSYHLFSEHFFVEIINQKDVLITDLTDPIIPLIRYWVGDIGELALRECACGNNSIMLDLGGRADKKFNFMGNLVSFKMLQNVIFDYFKYEMDFQLQLSTDSNGKDLLNIIINDSIVNIEEYKGELISKILKLDDINEAILKNTGHIEISDRKNFKFSFRQKLLPIVDMR